jgi:nucleotide-binding universal stress UspA family protein
MFERMLVVLDGTPESEVSLTAIRDLAHALQSEVHLLGVCPEGTDAQGHDALLARLDAHAGQFAAMDLRVGTHVRAATAVEAILATVQLLSADLLVVIAPRGLNVDIMAHVDVPILLVPPRASTDNKLERVLVAIDESVAAALGLAVAVELAQRVGPELTILRVIAPFPEWAFDGGPGNDLACDVDPEWDTETMAGAQRHVDGLAHQLELEGFGVTARTGLGTCLKRFCRSQQK